MTDWRTVAACRGMDPAVFFPVPTGQQSSAQRRRYNNPDHPAWAPALAVCARCDVRDACLDAALDEPQQDGMRGGLVPAQRRPMVVERAQARRESGTHRGSRACYQGGCRLPQCCAAQSAYAREQQERRRLKVS